MAPVTREEPFTWGFVASSWRLNMHFHYLRIKYRWVSPISVTFSHGMQNCACGVRGTSLCICVPPAWFLYMQISRGYRIYRHRSSVLRHLYIVVKNKRKEREKREIRNRTVMWRNDRDDLHVRARTCRRARHSTMELCNRCNNMPIFSYIYIYIFQTCRR